MVYDKPFTPSDNRTHQRRDAREDIRVIDGKSFYELATGDSEAIKKLYNVLPAVINNLLSKDGNKTNHSYQQGDDSSFSADIIRDAPRGYVGKKSRNTEENREYTELFEKVY